MKKIDQMTRLIPVVYYTTLGLFVLCALFSSVAWAETTTEISIEELQQAYNQQLNEYNGSQNKLENVYTEMRATEAKLKALDTEKNNTVAALKDIQRIDRENPNLELSAKVSEAKERNRIAFSSYHREQQKLKTLRIQSISLDKQVKDEINALNHIARSIKKAHDRIVAVEVEKRITKFKKSSVVEGIAEVGCGDESPRKCQNRAKRTAERNASEKGSIVIIKAATSIENFQLTRDQVKTEVQAQLSNVEVLGKGWKGDTTYRYHIKATVTPVISGSLRKQIEESIAHELGIVVPQEVNIASQNSRPSANQISKTKTAAERSFAELDRETGQSTATIEHGDKPQQAEISATKTRQPEDTQVADDTRRRIFGAW